MDQVFPVGARVTLTAAGRRCRNENGKPYLGEELTVTGYRGFDTNRWIVEVAGAGGRKDVYFEHCIAYLV